MRNLNYPELVLELLLLFILSGCSTIQNINSKEEAADIHTVELEHKAVAAYKNEDIKTSEKYYLLLIKRQPGEARYWFHLGNIYARTQRSEAAISAYREAVLRKPDYGKAWYNLGILQLKQAAYTFNAMQAHTPSDDVLNKDGKRILEEILDIVNR